MNKQEGIQESSQIYARLLLHQLVLFTADMQSLRSISQHDIVSISQLSNKEGIIGFKISFTTSTDTNFLYFYSRESRNIHEWVIALNSWRDLDGITDIDSQTLLSLYQCRREEFFGLTTPVHDDSHHEVVNSDNESYFSGNSPHSPSSDTRFADALEAPIQLLEDQIVDYASISSDNADELENLSVASCDYFEDMPHPPTQSPRVSKIEHDFNGDEPFDSPIASSSHFPKSHLLTQPQYNLSKLQSKYRSLFLHTPESLFSQQNDMEHIVKFHQYRVQYERKLSLARMIESRRPRSQVFETCALDSLVRNSLFDTDIVHHGNLFMYLSLCDYEDVSDTEISLWVRRYFVLTKTHLAFGDDEGTIGHAIPCEKIKFINMAQYSTAPSLYCMELLATTVAPDSTALKLCAQDHEDCVMWINAIQNMIRDSISITVEDILNRTHQKTRSVEQDMHESSELSSSDDEHLHTADENNRSRSQSPPETFLAAGRATEGLLPTDNVALEQGEKLVTMLQSNSRSSSDIHAFQRNLHSLTQIQNMMKSQCGQVHLLKQRDRIVSIQASVRSLHTMTEHKMFTQTVKSLQRALHARNSLGTMVERIGFCQSIVRSQNAQKELKSQRLTELVAEFLHNNFLSRKNQLGMQAQLDAILQMQNTFRGTVETVHANQIVQEVITPLQSAIRRQQSSAAFNSMLKSVEQTSSILSTSHHKEHHSKSVNHVTRLQSIQTPTRQVHPSQSIIARTPASKSTSSGVPSPATSISAEKPKTPLISEIQQYFLYVRAAEKVQRWYRRMREQKKMVETKAALQGEDAVTTDSFRKYLQQEVHNRRRHSMALLQQQQELEKVLGREVLETESVSTQDEVTEQSDEDEELWWQRHTTELAPSIDLHVPTRSLRLSNHFSSYKNFALQFDALNQLDDDADTLSDDQDEPSLFAFIPGISKSPSQNAAQDKDKPASGRYGHDDEDLVDSYHRIPLNGGGTPFSPDVMSGGTIFSADSSRPLLKSHNKRNSGIISTPRSPIHSLPKLQLEEEDVYISGNVQIDEVDVTGWEHLDIGGVDSPMSPFQGYGNSVKPTPFQTRLKTTNHRFCCCVIQ